MKIKTLSYFKQLSLAIITVVCFNYPAYCQLILSSPNTTGAYTAPTSITLSPDFSTAPVQTFSATITPDCTPLALNLSNNQNYIVTYASKVAGIINPADPNNTTCQVMATVEYFDGLGRPLQTVVAKGSPSLRDIVQPRAYDQFGREAMIYLPYSILPTTTSNGSYKSTAIPDQVSFYNNPTNPATWNALGVPKITFPYAETGFEPSPLNRVVEQGAYGDAWQLTGKPGTSNPGHTLKTDYATNDATSLTTGSGRWVKLYTVTLDANGKPSLIDGGSYSVNQLYVTVTKDENWIASDGKAGTTEEYKNKDGNTVLSRVFNTGGVAHSTYYVFDDLRNLTYVLPAIAEPDNGGITQITLDKVCFQYRYDGRQRLVERKIPGKGREYMVYNKIDQVVATQDSLKKLNNQWAYIKYDAMGRPVITGIWNNGGTAIGRINLQSQVDGQTANWETRDNNNTTNRYYSNTAFPTTNSTVMLTVNYYDDYSVPNLPATYDKHTSYSQMTRGLLTVALTNVLGTNDMLWSAHYYDDKGNIIKTFAQNYIGGTAQYNIANYDEISNSYDFTDNMTASVRNHHALSNPVLVIADSVVYDHMQRRVQTWKQINGGTKVLTEKLDYNEVGQLITKHLHSTNSGSTFLQNVSYRYNERGWMTKDSSGLFVMQLKYNDGTTPQYNGNIANQLWGTGSNLSKTYTYTYDKLNRLLSGVSNENFTEQGISYDKIGNIKTLTRIDPRIPATYNYVYGYDGNHLLTVSGLTSNIYTYDGNGNANYDAHNNVNIAYNILNLPGAISGSKNIVYTYDADGNKLRKVSTNTTFGTVDYDNGIQYLNSSVDFIKLDDGIARRSVDGTYNYEYTLSDQLGNNRVSFDNNANTARMIQQDDYYPYGLEYNRYLFGSKIEYLYNKKELQEELGQYDYGARFYDPVIGRFTSVDPMAEVSRRWSTYAYSYNNPIRFVDKDGMIPGDFLDEKGRKVGSDGKDDGKLYVIKTTDKNFDSGAPSAGISKDDKKATEKFIKDNNGNTSAFESNDIAYKNSVEIEGKASTRQGMVDVVNQDNGRGGTADANNREYGGVIKTDGTVKQSPAGPVSDPTVNSDAHIDIASFDFQSTFHSHPSGTKSVSSTGSNPFGGTTLGGSVLSGAFKNAPSNTGADVGNSGSKVNYVFSRGNGTVYIYNNTGVIATIPQANFVTPKQ